MRRTTFGVLLLAGLCFPSSFARSSHSSNRSSLGYTSGSVHVRSYMRRDGAYVSSHSRSLPRTGHGEIRVPRPARVPRTYSSFHAVTHPRSYSGFSNSGRSGPALMRGSHGRIERSAEARDAFKRQQPCPSTGKSSGPCPGYVIDHVKPLECGGADSPSNMQWQTIADGKAKDKTEAGCRVR